MASSIHIQVLNECTCAMEGRGSTTQVEWLRTTLWGDPCFLRYSYKYEALSCKPLGVFSYCKLASCKLLIILLTQLLAMFCVRCHCPVWFLAAKHQNCRYIIYSHRHLYVLASQGFFERLSCFFLLGQLFFSAIFPIFPLLYPTVYIHYKVDVGYLPMRIGGT